MGHKVKQSSVNSRVDFFYYAFRNVLLVSIPLLVVSGVVLSHLSFHSSATSSGSGTDNLTISISSACTLSSVVNTEHNTNTNVGTYTSDIGKTTITTLCNDGNGYSVYAVGYSNNEEGNNKLINSERPEYSIDTGLNTSGLTSAWAMKLNNIPDDPSPTPPTIESDYNNVYGIVPPYWTKVASRASGTTDMSQGSSFTTTYAVYASSGQYTGTYVGQVKYALTHPSTKPAYHFMQDVATWKDTELPSAGDSLQAIDSRDGKKYWVTRLADGNVWMTQNLDFDIVADEQDPTKMKTLTSEDTDLTDHSLVGAYSYANGYSYDSATGITSWTPASISKTISFEGAALNNWQSNDVSPYSASKTDDTNTGHASLGNYYNWTVAIASNNSSSLTTGTYNNVALNPQNSICPKGWRLPTVSNQPGTIAGSTNEFARLNYLYNNGSTTSSGNLLISPIWFIKSGYIKETLILFNTEGNYWSSTVTSGNGAGVISFADSTVNATSDYIKGRGRSIRCLAR